MTEFNKLQTVKRHFFAMRNGVIADALRKGGAPYKIIFGLNLPQLREIASEIGYDEDLADELRRNVSTRESQLMFPMLIDPSRVSVELAVELASECISAEAADILCHSLLRNVEGSLELGLKLCEENNSDMARYCGLRLLWHHLSAASQAIEPVARAEANRNCALTYRPAMQILDEIEFMRE